MKKIYLSAEPFCGNGYVLVDNMFFKFKGNKLVSYFGAKGRNIYEKIAFLKTKEQVSKVVYVDDEGVFDKELIIQSKRFIA